LFEKALEAPNDNCLAQIESISISDEFFKFTESQKPSPPLNFEARTLELYHKANWKGALDQAWKWNRDEPFARRSAVLGSYVADLMENFEEGRKFAAKGLQANPGDSVLINNLCFALAQLYRTDEARSEMKLVNISGLDAAEQIPFLATEGLINFREGQVIEGRALYQKAISMSQNDRFRKLRERALLHLALEEVRANTSDHWTWVKLALDETSKTKDPDVTILRDRLEESFLRRHAPSPSPQ
jgi:tetratricopeptide (TPR) repeat protein